VARNDRIARLLRLLELLRDSRRGLPLKTVADRHGWNLRSLYRDVEALEQAGYAVVRDGERYRVVDDARGVAKGAVDPAEMLALGLARDLIGPLAPTEVGRALSRLQAKLLGARHQASLFSATGAGLTVRRPFAIDYSTRGAVIASLERAIRERRTVSAAYQAASTGLQTRRVLEPGELYWDPGLEALYLIAYCRLRRDVRVFAVHRFAAVAVTRESYEPRPEARSDVALRSAFRLWRAHTVKRVVVHLDASAAPHAGERKWHRSQGVRPLPGGILELSFEVAGVEEIGRWLLSFGGAAQAIEPPELVSFMREQLASGFARYAAPAAMARPRRARGSLSRSDKAVP
jgi:predicted DNA-binding transcriptional regulator YafY